MPPKVKITKEEIINTCLDIVRKEGQDALNARNIANALNCSTQPIFFNFSSMEELKQAVKEDAYRLYLENLNKEAKKGEHPEYKAFGLGYIRFAKEERELFKFLFMCDRTGEDFVSTYDREKSIELIMEYNGISRENAELIQLEMWLFVHGIATMLATSYLDLDWNLISKMLTDTYKGISKRLKEADK